MSQLNRIWTAEGLVTPLHDALIYKNTKGRADSSWDIWWYLRYSTVDFMRFGHWIPGISSRRSQCWPKDFVSQKLVQYQADVWKYFPSLWCKVVVSNTFSLIGWCRMTFHLDPKDSSTPRHRRLVRWRSSMAKDLLKDLWAIRLSRQKTSNNARHECHYEAQTRYVCWQIQKLFAFSRCTIYHQSVLQAVFKRVLSCALLHLPVELLALEELVVATAVQELSLSTFDGLLGLGLPGIAHVQQDLWNISKNTMQMVTGYHMVSYSIIWSDHMTMGLKALPRQDFLQSLMKAGYGNGHLCFSFSFSSQHRVCHLWAFDGLQNVIRLHSEAQMEWDPNRRDITNPEIWKNQCSQGTESFALFGPCSDVLRPGSKTELFWAAAGLQWNSGRAEEETGLPTKSAARLWVQWVSQCTCFPLSDLVIFGKPPQASAEAFLCHAVRSVPQILGASWHILTSVERGWWLVSVTISSNGTRVWQAWGKWLWVEYFGQTQMLMIFDNGDDNMTMVATTLVVVAVMFCKVTVYSTRAVIVICRVEKTWNDTHQITTCWRLCRASLNYLPLMGVSLWSLSLFFAAVASQQSYNFLNVRDLTSFR